MELHDSIQRGTAACLRERSPAPALFPPSRSSLCPGSTTVESSLGLRHGVLGLNQDRCSCLQAQKAAGGQGQPRSRPARLGGASVCKWHLTCSPCYLPFRAASSIISSGAHCRGLGALSDGFQSDSGLGAGWWGQQRGCVPLGRGPKGRDWSGGWGFGDPSQRHLGEPVRTGAE